MQTLDKLDRQILRSLQLDGRATYDQLAAAVGLSPSAVLRRVKRLEDSGVIDRYVALIKPESVGLGLTAYLTVRLKNTWRATSASQWTCSAPACGDLARGGRMRGIDRRDGLPAARAGGGHGALQPLHHGHACSSMPACRTARPASCLTG